jgi:hypothetical protein
MEDQEKWFTDQEREYLWGELENYLEDEEWSERLADEEGVPFDPALVKSTWVKLDRFDKQGPIGLQFTQQEQDLLSALLSSNVGVLECTKISECTKARADRSSCPTDEDCIGWHDLVQAIIRKLPAPALQHNWVVDLEKLIDAVRDSVFQNPGETQEEYMARVQRLYAQRLREEVNTMTTLENMLKATK